MPVCYPNETHCVHTWTYIWANFICPNARSAIFWAPLEHYSVAKRNLLSGHRIIPWIAGWIPYEDSNAYDCSPPSRSDCRALIQHLRLRGADGYYNLCGNWNPNYTDNDDYRMDMRDAWKTLDDNATNIGVKSIINLATDKVAGIQWSGVRNGNDVKILISNLGNVSQSVNYPSIFGLPAASPAVAPGQHVFYDYTISNLVKNPGFEPGATGWYLCAGATWQSTGGVENSPCIKMQGGYYSFISSDLFPTEGGAKMCIDVSACGVSSPNLMICYYYYDKDGVVLGVGNPGFDKAIGSTMQGYVSAFTVVNDPRIKYIGLIFYNKYGLTDPNDIIYVDNVSLKFSE